MQNQQRSITHVSSLTSYAHKNTIGDDLEHPVVRKGDRMDRAHQTLEGGNEKNLLAAG